MLSVQTSLTLKIGRISTPSVGLLLPGILLHLRYVAYFRMKNRFQVAFSLLLGGLCSILRKYIFLVRQATSLSGFAYNYFVLSWTVLLFISKEE